MPWYKTGTVAVTLNSNAVNGTGTAFIVNCRVGDAFRGPDGRWYEVTNVASNTAISIDPPYLGVTAGGGSYALAPMQGYVKDSADQLRAIVNTYGAKLAALGTTGNYDILPVSKGGTGGATQSEARSGLGLGTAATVDAGATGTAVMASATPAAGRTALGLGTAATANVTTSALAASGMMKVGDFGLGQSSAISITDLDTSTLATGMYRFDSPVGGFKGLPQGIYAVWINRINTGSAVGQIATNFATGLIYSRGSSSSNFAPSHGIERGSNSSGEYVKYPDGTMLAWITGATLTFGNSANLSYAWSFPIAFIAAPMVVPQIDLSNYSLKIYGTIKEVYKRNVAASSCSIGLASASQWVSGDENLVTIGAIATGRWF